MDKSASETPKVVMTTPGEGGKTGDNQNLVSEPAAARQNRAEEPNVRPWKEKLQEFVPEQMAKLIIAMGYDSEDSLNTSVTNKVDAQDWIKLLLVDCGYQSMLPSHKWRIDPMAGKLRKLWESCRGHNEEEWPSPPPPKELQD